MFNEDMKTYHWLCYSFKETVVTFSFKLYVQFMQIKPDKSNKFTYISANIHTFTQTCSSNNTSVSASRIDLESF